VGRAIILADTRRLAGCFGAVDYVDNRRLPYVVALNQFVDAPRYEVAEVRMALRVPDHVPLLTCDARDRYEVRQALIALVEHVLSLRPRPASATPTTE
jgi:signal recognition particle receptor subunit beta